MLSPQIHIHEIELIGYYGEEYDITLWVFTKDGPHAFHNLIVDPVFAQGVLSFTHMYADSIEMNVDFLEKNVLYIGHSLKKKKGTQLDG